MNNIHATAIVSPKAKLGNNIYIGPYCIVNDNVEIGDGCKFIANVYIDGNTKIGKKCNFYPYSSIGTDPQDLKYNGEKSTLEIGNNNTFREYVTVNPGTNGGGLITSIGDNCLFMINCHIAHDCIIGNNVILVNNASLAGHVIIDDFAIIGALSGIHQFCRIGKHSMIGAMSGIDSDVIPYGTVVGNRAFLSGLNIIGLKRRGFSKIIIQDLKKAYGVLFVSNEGTISERIKEVSEDFSKNEPVMEIVEFLTKEKSRSICKPKNVS
ncbi:MAG: Acyl-[acyl-carrier-protein]--UDP-N-acetylglucosamine O-acyltransferase [Alphaproteobacteria bacterium MarineAlpha9_Bin4]|nr:MAG: Acyl-[acyl-carrier-protein]--UDP-N-acetylglucosamine O-acyltransferase [Alphaproteobacteria bacterium MarineAlpha9_Bin4]|tara:strand:- start:1819 stop:2616 length:798 start_codon:yes stop_codon:yes gene_type:complete